MSRYINSDLFEKELEKLHYSGEIHVDEKLVNFMNEFPTADVREVRRGKWFSEIGDAHSTGKYRACSICGGNVFIPYFSKQGIENVDFDFCPNCGAEMEVE